MQTMEIMKEAGLKISPFLYKTSSMEEIIELCQEWADERHDLTFDYRWSCYKGVNSWPPETTTQLVPLQKLLRWAVLINFLLKNKPV